MKQSRWYDAELAKLTPKFKQQYTIRCAGIDANIVPTCEKCIQLLLFANGELVYGDTLHAANLQRHLNSQHSHCYVAKL